MSRGQTPTQSPGSDVSPRSQPAPKGSDYFVYRPKQTGLGPAGHPSNARSETPLSQTEFIYGAPAIQQYRTGHNATDVKGKGREAEIPANASATTTDSASSNGSSEHSSSRKASVSSIAFLAPRNTLPQGNKRPHGAGRIRGASPPHRRLVYGFLVVFSPFPSCARRCRHVSIKRWEDCPSGQARMF